MPVFEVHSKITYAGPGSPGANIWHFRTDSWETGIDDNRETALQTIRDFYVQSALCYPSTVTINVADSVTRIDEEEPVLAPTNGYTVSGTSSAGELPERLAVLLRLQTAHGGRSGRGRKFLGPVATTCLESNGTVDEARRDQFMGAITGLITASASNVAGWGIGVWSRKNHELYDFVAASVDNEFAQLSSRRF